MLRSLLLITLLLPLAANAKLAWQFQTDGQISGQPVVHNNIVYAAGGKTLYALNKKGETLWKYDAKGEIFSRVTIESNMLLLHPTWLTRTAVASCHEA